MIRFIPFFLIILFVSVVFADSGTVTVTVINSQTVTGLTEIKYEFTGDFDVYNISAEVSFDNGSIFQPIFDAHLEGALTNVAPGGPYFLTWNGRASYPETFSDETVVKIVAAATIFNCDDDITFTYRGSEVTYGTVVRGGLCWLDRNLGAEGIATFNLEDATENTDTRLYGDLFQWGRLDDGHQARTSSTTPGPVNQDVPGHGNFITVSSPNDWRSPQNDDLWQGVNGINNPCPEGWRVPTEAELNAERQSWGSNNSAGAYASTLKWPVGGGRDYDGTLGNVGSYGYVWSSSVDGPYARLLSFDSGGAGMGSLVRVLGMGVRCVRDN